MRTALLVLDLINDLVHPEGKLSGFGTCQQVAERGVLHRTRIALRRARAAGIPVVYLTIGWDAEHTGFPVDSPLFGAVRPDQRPVLGSWGTRVHDAVAPAAGEPVLAKSRVSPFHGTELAELLRGWAVDELLLTGVTTDLVVLSTAREAHDRDFQVRVLADATATDHPDLHVAALTVLARTATVTRVADALPG
jgi:nicotinamidase-related amidase